MTIEVVESWNSRKQVRSSSSSQDVEYIINGTDNDDEACTAMLAYAPETWIVGGDVELPVVEAEISERLAETFWKGMVHYGQGPGPLESSFGFDTTGGRAKITQSLSTTIYPSGAPDFLNAIGVTESGVEGCEIVVPALQLWFGRKLPAGFITPSYIQTLESLTGTYNNGTFSGREAGTLRFDGATGQVDNPASPADVKFYFTSSPHVSGLEVAGISGITKRGWDYLWVRYQQLEDDSAKAVVQRALGVYVEEVIGPGDFSLLGIGV